jgi:PhnB protein
MDARPVVRRRGFETVQMSESGQMTGIEPELWVDGASAAVAFYQAAFDAVVLHRVGDGDDIVAQLAVGTAEFWVTEANSEMRR